MTANTPMQMVCAFAVECVQEQRYQVSSISSSGN